MSDRTVKVTIRAITNDYLSGMDKVQQATSKASSAAEKLQKRGEAFDKVGKGVLTVGAAAAVAVGLVVKSSADFDAEMSKVQAATNATASEMDKFRNQALTAGAAFGYTAEQVTEAQVELGKAGLATKDILGGGLNGVLALAASDNIDLGKATQIASVAMKQFNLTGKDVPHIADELAAGAGKALGGVEQLGDALNQSGLVASNFGFSLEETTGVLSSFADAGLLGSDAGTSLKTMLQALANPSKQSADLMKTLGINVKDANGNFLGAADLAQLLHDKLGKLSDAQRQQALAQIFGSDATRAATVLFKEAGDGIQGYIDQNNDAGYAMEQAAIKSDNLNGDLKKLRSAFQSGLIEAGTSADGALRPVVQTITNVIQAVNQLPDPLKGAALGVTGIVGATSLLAGGFLVVVPKIAEFRAALATLRDAGFTGRAALSSITGFLGGPWGIALTVAAAAAVAFGTAQMESARYTGQLRDTLDSTTGALTKNTRELIANALAAKTSIFGIEVSGSSAYDKAKRLGLSLETVTKAAQGNTKAYKELLAAQKDIRSNDDNDAVTKKYGEGLSAASADITELVQAVEKQRGAMKSAKDQQKQLNEAQEESSSTSSSAATGLDTVTDSAEDATQAISDTANAIKGFNSAQLDVNSAQRDFEAAIDGVTDSITQNGQSLDITTDKGRQNASALDQIGQSALNLAGSLYAQSGSQDDATGSLDAGRKALIAALGQYGVTGQAAEDYANKVMGTPESWATLFTADTGGATTKLTDLKSLVATVQGKSIYIGANVDSSQIDSLLAKIRSARSAMSDLNGAASGTGRMGTYASGGAVHGPGTGTSDSVRARLSNGEHVLTAANVAAMGGQSAVYGFRAALMSKQQSFASGGAVYAQPRYASQMPSGGSRAAAAPASERVYAQTNIYPSADLDARTFGTVMGRELGRRIAGMV